jgi:ligand-binding sensor domain-containing protein
MEWVNSGLPSSLSQVMHSNVVNLGIHFERKYPGRQVDLVGPYQARYTSPVENTWYDKFNSTVDYELLVNYANIGSHMPYAACVLYVESREEVWVGGPGGVLVIDIASKSVSSLTIDRRRALNIKSLKLFNDQIYILDEHGLYIYDLITSEIERDSGLGLPNGLFALAIMLNTNIVIGGSNGIYARKKNQESWQRVVESEKIDILANPDACFAVEERTKVWYSTDGFSWQNIGTMPSGVEINKIEKHRSQLYIGTNKGLYEDNGSFYGGSVAIALVDVLNDPSESVKLIINDIASDFDRCVFGLSDGSYFPLVHQFR